MNLPKDWPLPVYIIAMSQVVFFPDKKDINFVRHRRGEYNACPNPTQPCRCSSDSIYLMPIVKLSNKLANGKPMWCYLYPGC